MDKVLGLIQILVLKSESVVNTTEVKGTREAGWGDTHTLRLEAGNELQPGGGGFAAHLRAPSYPQALTWTGGMVPPSQI